MNQERNREAAARIDCVCDAFEAAWQGDGRPMVEQFLGTTPEPERTRLLQELLLLEVEYRVRLGERPSPADYLPRFPDQAGVIEAAFRRAIPEHPGSSPREPPAALTLTATEGPHTLPWTTSALSV